MPMTRLALSGTRLLLRGARLLIECCCGDPTQPCGCCLDVGTTEASCVDTGLTGVEGEEYCTNVLGGQPMIGVWFNREAMCVPCDGGDIFGGSSNVVYATCAPTPGTCASMCDDIPNGAGPTNMFLAIDGPFADPPPPAAPNPSQCYLDK